MKLDVSMQVASAANFHIGTYGRKFPNFPQIKSLNENQFSVLISARIIRPGLKVCGRRAGEDRT